MSISDLFTPSSDDELSNLSDGDLIVAALCIEPSSDEDARDEAAWRLAVILDLAKSQATAEVILKRSFEVASVWPMVSAIACHSGLFNTTSRRQDYPEARHDHHAMVLAALRTRHAASIAHLVVSELAQRPPSSRIEFESVHELAVLEESLRVITDPQLLLAAIRQGSTLHSDIAITRLTEVGGKYALFEALPITKRSSADGHYSGHQRVLNALDRLATTPA
jgi:hypothetical protein